MDRPLYALSQQERIFCDLKVPEVCRRRNLANDGNVPALSALKTKRDASVVTVKIDFDRGRISEPPEHCQQLLEVVGVDKIAPRAFESIRFDLHLNINTISG